MKEVRAKNPEKPLNELMRFLFCKPVDGDLNDQEDGQPILFSSSASNVGKLDSKNEGKMSLCFVNVGDKDDSDDF
jgi:hypothetical protein